MPSAATDSSRPPLTRDSIIAAAMAIADQEGVGALSMRNLARRLHYEVMSLYNHVANKDELLAAMVDQVAAAIEAPNTTAAPLAAVRALAVSTHDALAAHPWAPALWLRHVPGPARTQRMEDLLRLLYSSGLSPELAHHGFHAVNNHVIGYTLQEIAMVMELTDPEVVIADYLAATPVETYPYMVEHIHQHLSGDTASSFELVLDLIIDGLRRLNEAD